MPQPEAKFKAKLKEGFEKFYNSQPHFYFAIVASMMQMAGVPDVFVAAEGRSAWIEAKVDDGKLRPTQKIVIPRMTGAGARVVVLHTDMKADRSDRPVVINTWNGTALIPCAFFRWTDLSSHMFWRTLLGIYA